MRKIKIIELALIAASLSMSVSSATRRYIVELSTEPVALFASHSFGPSFAGHRESLSRPELQTHRTMIRDEQDAALVRIRERYATRLGGAVDIRWIARRGRLRHCRDSGGRHSDAGKMTPDPNSAPKPH